MALINRMSRLFTADVHAVLDRIEEPDVLLAIVPDPQVEPALHDLARELVVAIGEADVELLGKLA